MATSLETRLIAALAAIGDAPFPGGSPALRKALGYPSAAELRDLVQRLRWAGKVDMEALKLSPSMLAIHSDAAGPTHSPAAAEVSAAPNAEQASGGEAATAPPLVAVDGGTLREWRAAQCEQLLDWLEQVAAAGEPCPKNIEIAERFGHLKPTSGLQLLQILEASGRITVERFGTSRVVTITASGLATARPAGKTIPHWRDREAAAQTASPPAPPPAPVIVETKIIPPAEIVRAPARSLADEVKHEAEVISARRRQAQCTGTVKRPIAARRTMATLLADPELTDIERLSTALVEEPGDLMRAVIRRHADLWRRVIEAGRSMGRRPGEALLDAIEAGLECLEDPEAA